jgi:hypothetical protein
MMEDSHTLAGYIIAIISVLGSAWLLPPFPIFILSIGPLSLLGLLVFLLFRKVRAQQERPMILQHDGPQHVRKENAA